MRTKVIFGIIWLISPLIMPAQSNDESEVKAVITALFDGMREADSSKVRAAFASGAILQTVKTNANGVVEVIGEKPDDFIKSIANQSRGVLDEQITYATFYSDGQLATVATPYKFYYNGNFSHCGTNAFQLVKMNGVWKIQYIIDTRRRTGCD